MLRTEATKLKKISQTFTILREKNLGFGMQTSLPSIKFQVLA